MKSWERVLIAPTAPLRDALEKIDKAGTRMVLVVDETRRLLGSLSDGDIRRGLLSGRTLADPVTSAMHVGPKTADVSDGRDAILVRMRKLGLYQMPVIDAEGVVVGLETVDDLLATPVRENPIVIMAGGRGVRLAELTRDTPKPMLRVGARPLLETIIMNLAVQGFSRIHLAVNYKAEQIEQHFGDGSAFDVRISYLREDRPMGTAGALSLLKKMPEVPLIVTNADLLTKENYGHMLDRHLEAKAHATMAVRNYEMQVPFGVVHEGKDGILAIDEKPIQRFIVSAGMYVLSPEVIKMVPKDQPIDMPALFELAMQRSLHTRCHHIDGYWLDIGRMADYERANIDFAEIFR
ncbi:nucleotidyltransferase family protein [Bradyrhizobium centrosematis]|uniref:nucleotidyltransferase family protein n=1 Tax=Bradyrhizobium centrosematis TaxID=1300039 RepID=UPI00216963BF|nr:nucleotidyltransferase family protein [Bradyrhizobium centrosematis]MCS3765316.1 dTDP-glucose pyrophosphorylase [Bradyrhizobium centrosematis]MCS3773984.1 dTDP-glucose pyrophosphorylase [Bradyrhizobium centrosematis]